MPIKVTTGSAETLTYTHIHVKSFTLSKPVQAGSPYRIDIVAKRFDDGGNFDNADLTYTCLSFIPLLFEILVDQDGITPGQEGATINAALNAADKGNCAECFAGLLEAIGKILHQVELIEFEEVEA